MNNSAEKNSPVVLKFGGSSVAEIKHWNTIVERLILELGKNRNPILVLSALKDVSNTLEGILHLAISNDYQTEINQLLDKHIHFAEQLKISVKSQLNDYAKQLLESCREIYQTQSITPKMHAKILAYGELMSTTIGHAFICQSGIDATLQDARELLTTETQPDDWHHFTSAVCNFDYSQQLSNRLFSPSDSCKVVVTQGFIASDRLGNTVLLGREGSDTTAAYLAAKLGAKELQIWTDVTGVFSANPAEVSSAQQIDQLSYQQAHTMAILGAKVLHPKVIRPVATNNISLSVRSTWFPECRGTQISSFQNPSDGPHSVMLMSDCTMLTIKKSPIGSERLNQTLTLLAELGFDCLLIESEEGVDQIILKYTNTDTPIPTVSDLVRTLKIQPENLILKGDLLSIVGSKENLGWQPSTVSSVRGVSGFNFIVQFVSKEEGRTSFYSDSPVSKAMLKELHDKLFEE